MADRTIVVLTEAEEFDLLTVDECKLLLGLDPNDHSQDAQLEMMISMNSALIAEVCNRTFAKEKVRESWREIGDGRLFLSHWPVKPDDIESVMSGDTSLDPANGDYELEPASGKVSVYGGPWFEPAVVTYTGGYDLPTDAPLPLKQATAILVREERIRNQQALVAGVRQIAHEGRHVSYFDPAALLRATSGHPVSWAAAGELLKQYTRFEI